MDAYSISYTTASRRNSSRLYQDLSAFRQNGYAAVDSWLYTNGMESSRKERQVKSESPPHIGIVGAGFSGLRCADILIQRGFKVTIIEGRDRIGGRVQQVKIPGTQQLVDLGANWIHGTEDNPILDLAKKTETATHSWGDKSQIFDENGEAVPTERAEELGEIMWSIIVDAFKYSNQNTKTIDPRRSLHDWFVERLDERFPGDDAESRETKRIVLQMSEMWGAFVGSEIKHQTLKFFWLEECIDGENLFCAGTYEKILFRIAKTALEKADIKFLTRATKITSNYQGTSKVAVRTDFGEDLLFDEVVMTTPLGWLKTHTTAFSPPLPPRTLSAISSLGYGHLEKVYITFPTAFWHSQSPTPDSFVSTSNGYANGTTPSNPSKPDNESYTGFTQWITPTYDSKTFPSLSSKSPSPTPFHFNQEAVELASLPTSTSHPTLLFYIFGTQSLSLTSHISSLPPSSRIPYLLSYFQPYYSHLPNYSTLSKTSPQKVAPVAAVATNWSGDELAGCGSYCNFQKLTEEGKQFLDEDVEVLRRGVPERGVWMAGEHTSPFVALGTVTGAYWSGEGVAGRIAGAYGRGEGGQNGAADTGVNGGVNGDGEEKEKEKEQEVNVRGFSDVPLVKDGN